MPYKDPEKAKAYHAKYRLLNKNKINQARRDYYHNNKEESLRRSREYREKHKEELAKANRDYYQENKEVISQRRKPYHKKYSEENKDKISAYGKKHYNENKDLYRQRSLRNRKKRKKWFLELKLTLRCIVCGENHPACLEFHHRDASLKRGLVSHMVKQALSEKRILEEIAKCDILCSNCHRKLHYNNKLIKKDECSISQKYRRKRAELVSLIKSRSACVICGETNPACLDFHHRNAVDKVDAISKMVSEAVNEDRFLEEVSKCEIVCSNCHRKLHFNER